MARQLKITVDYNVCVGNAMCETFAENTFGLNDDRQSYVKDPAGDPEETIIEAAENCPVTAITVEDARPGRFCSRNAAFSFNGCRGSPRGCPDGFGQPQGLPLRFGNTLLRFGDVTRHGLSPPRRTDR